ncbi:tetratricopeptide repeat protein [Flavobacterium ardleyense]|uniref:tetratricopeptide repeat protein n=1 Tax=Flavobacterium ardleyense TaxID=2038737 RepID=UPI00298BFD74|nr:tetratricopeptide repeat protein [Flavobacterium ardleyense]
MKAILFFLSLLYSVGVLAQSEQLAQHYYDKGDFEKAKLSYEELSKQQPSNTFYFLRLIETQQQLEQYDLAEVQLLNRYKTYKQPSLLVEIGYNYQLKKEDSKAKKYYDEAVGSLDKNPNEVYSIAGTFEKKVLVEYALRTYERAIAIEPKYNFNYKMALLYGQSGNVDKMISTFLDEAAVNQSSIIVIQNQLSRFLAEDQQDAFSDSLRKALLIRVQKEQDVFWNGFLSWYYVQKKEFARAFVQEKAIFKRNPQSLSNILNLAQLSIEEKDVETSRNILNFILESTSDSEILIQANLHLLEMEISDATAGDQKKIEPKIQAVLNQFGVSRNTLKIQLLQAHFLAFELNEIPRAKEIIDNALKLPLNTFEQADVKMEMADIFLLQQKFNQALLFYTQIENDLKNDPMGHEASLKAAKTSYFKGDFDWAQKQFGTLKTAVSQLIANDALEYFLLINDSNVADSTQVALKQYAKGDYLKYQNKNQEALQVFQQLLLDYKGDQMEAVTHLQIGEIYRELGQYDKALLAFQEIISKHEESIYVDEALYYSAEILSKSLNKPDEAKAFYEKILFNHQDSIYFTDSREKYRILRGDVTL